MLAFVIGPQEYYCGNPYEFGIPLENDGVRDN
jgi:hypothetical protein